MDSYKKYGYLDMAPNKKKRKTSASRPAQGGSGSPLIFWIVPFIVINVLIFFLVTAEPSFEITLDDNDGYESATVTVKLLTHFPRKSFDVSFASEPLEMEKVSGNTYTATVDTNGTVEVSVTNLNGMSKTSYDTVNTIDDAPPVVSEYQRTSESVSLFFEDDQSGVDFASVYALDHDGATVTPSLLDEGESFVTFNFTSGSLEVHVKDKAGHESVAVFDRPE